MILQRRDRPLLAQVRPLHPGVTGRAGALLWPAAYVEPGADPAAVARALAAELRTLAHWPELDAVAVGRRGGFARRLAAALRQR